MSRSPGPKSSSSPPAPSSIPALKADPQLSDREHGRRCGVDHKTVTTARARLEQREEIPHVDERVDSAGRLQPATKPQSETDEEWLARTLAEVGEGTFTIPATPEEMIARMRELDEEQERIERIVYERKLAGLQEQPPSAQRDAREVGLVLRYQRDQMRRAFHKSGATSIEKFAEMADLYVGYVHDILMLDEVDQPASPAHFRSNRTQVRITYALSRAMPCGLCWPSQRGTLRRKLPTGMTQRDGGGSPLWLTFAG